MFFDVMSWIFCPGSQVQLIFQRLAPQCQRMSSYLVWKRPHAYLHRTSNVQFSIDHGPERMYAFNDQPHCLQILLLELEKVPWKLSRSLWSMKKHLGKAVKVFWWINLYLFLYCIFSLSPTIDLRIAYSLTFSMLSISTSLPSTWASITSLP